MTNVFQLIRQIYLYAVCGIALIVMVISSIGMVNLVLEEYVFDVKGWDEINKDYWQCTEAEFEYYGHESVEECIESVDENVGLEHTNDQKRDLANFISMLVVAIPLYIFHWKIIRKEKK
jgi:hypothetical protein